MLWMQRVIAFVNRDFRFRTLRLFTGVLLLGAVFGAAPSIKADPIVVGGNWYEFQFLGSGTQAFACNSLCFPSLAGNSQFAPNPPWTFTLSQAGVLTVTDAFNRGDAFDVFDFGVLIGSTPNVPEFDFCSTDPVVCLADPAVSHGVFLLAPGPHSITIVVRVSSGNGAAYFRVDEVPEPTTLLLLTTGLGGAIGVVRRKKKTRS